MLLVIDMLHHDKIFTGIKILLLYEHLKIIILFYCMSTMYCVGFIVINGSEDSKSKCTINHIFLFIYLQKHFLLRIWAHFCIGIVFGYLYSGVGSKADTVFGNYVYLYGTTLFLVYTGKMAVTLSSKLRLTYNAY